MVIRRSKSYAALLLSLALFIGAACDKQGSGSVDAKQVFTDPKAAEVAEAAAEGDGSQVRKLIKAGVDPNARGDLGVNLLQWAVLHKSKDGLEALLEAGADPARADDSGETVLHYAAKANEAIYLEILLAKRADPNTPNTVTGVTPLMTALFGQREEQFRMLLAAGAKPDNADRQGNTALHVAAKIYATKRVLDLLKAGANPSAKNKQGVTFQRYLSMMPENLMAENARREREAIVDWLLKNNVPLEDPPKR
jgi:hypothetical protein